MNLNCNRGSISPKEGSTSPKYPIVCDQFICYPDEADNIYENKNSVDVITLSNQNNNSLVMSASEIQQLANQLNNLKKYFYSQSFSVKPFLDYGLDIEFKLNGANRELYIKQVRLYND